MASDLISRDMTYAVVKDYFKQKIDRGEYEVDVVDCNADLQVLLFEQPTVDAVEVVRQLWKKTTEEKPNSTKHLIVTDGGLISHYGYYVKPKDKWYKTWECKEEISEPAFWMDMPEPPLESILDECCC